MTKRLVTGQGSRLPGRGGHGHATRSRVGHRYVLPARGSKGKREGKAKGGEGDREIKIKIDVRQKY